MSLSGLIERTHLIDKTVLAALVEKNQPRWASCSTLEERQGVEAETLDLLDVIMAGQTSLNTVSVFDHPTQESFDELYKQHEVYLAANDAKLAEFAQALITRGNNYQLALQEIIGQIKRIKQKHATLNLWNDKARFFLANKFHSIEALDFNYTAVEANNIDTNQGLVSLPVQARERVEIGNIRLGAGSNGQAGSSDALVSSSNQDVRVLIGAGGVFEYERMDEGPCTLVLALDFARPSIVNSINIKPENIGYPLSVNVENIQLALADGSSISVHKLIPDSHSEDIFSIPITSEEGWDLTFLPVEAISLSIELSQTQSYPVEAASPDGTAVLRERFAIPLKSITVNKLRYKEEGGLNSKPIDLRNNLYALEPIVDVSPRAAELYDLVLEVSFDGGGSWRVVFENGVSTAALIDSTAKDSFLWRLRCNRNSESFSTFSSFVENDNPFEDAETLLKPVSRFSSPANISLTSKPKDSNVFVIQPKVGRRGQKGKAIRLGTSTGGVNNLRVPFNILKHNLNPEQMKLYVGGVEYAQKLPGETIGALEWQFSDDHDEVILSSDLPSGSNIDITLDEELMLLEERADGYYHKMKLGFDPDKPNIEVFKLSAEPSRGSILLPPGKKIVYLGHKNILSGSFAISSPAGNAWTEVDDRNLVYDAADHEFYVDYANGFIYLASVPGADKLRCSYDFQDETLINPDEFDLVYEDARPWGIKIKKTSLDSIKISEVVGNNLLSVIDTNTGEYGVRTETVPAGSAAARQLSHGSIIKGTLQVSIDFLDNGLIPEEVDFIDGSTEFLGLTQILDERTNEQTADGTGVTSFSLSARSLWYKDLSVTFSNTAVFANEQTNLGDVTSTGDYYIDNEGLVSVFVSAGGTLPGNILMSYYFKNEILEGDNKYSVDYEDGVVYSLTDLNQDSRISYKIAKYKVGYDIARPVNAFVYNANSNTVAVRTENLDPVNNLVKVVWVQAPQSLVSGKIEEYFSPLINTVGFRFS